MHPCMHPCIHPSIHCLFIVQPASPHINLQPPIHLSFIHYLLIHLQKLTMFLTSCALDFYNNLRKPALQGGETIIVYIYSRERLSFRDLSMANKNCVCMYTCIKAKGQPHLGIDCLDFWVSISHWCTTHHWLGWLASESRDSLLPACPVLRL